MIRQDHRGRLYRVVYFDNVISGQRTSVELPYTPTNAPPARTIPVEDPPVKQRRASGPMFARTAHVIELRDNSKFKFVQERESSDKIHKLECHSIEHFNAVLEAIKPLMRSPDCGKTWIALEPVVFDWHQCYHLNEEQKA